MGGLGGLWGCSGGVEGVMGVQGGVVGGMGDMGVQWEGWGGGLTAAVLVGTVVAIGPAVATVFTGNAFAAAAGELQGGAGAWVGGHWWGRGAQSG